MAQTQQAVYRQDGQTIEYSPVAAVTGGEVLCLPDGRAGVAVTDIAAGAQGSFQVSGIHRGKKTASLVVLPGARMWFDHSANTFTCVPQYADKDFYAGVAVLDSTASETEVDIDLNAKPNYVVDLHESGGDSVVVLTAGTPFCGNRGGALVMAFSATAEAQKADWLSKRSVPLGSNWIWEADVEVYTTADADVADLSLGVANASHASDADSITESAFFHLDLGADLNIDAESDDGTTEVAATDTTIDFVVGTPFHLAIDGRDPTDCKFYVNGVEVLNATADLGNIQLATGPLKALAHLEKSANDTAGEVHLHHMAIRITE